MKRGVLTSGFSLLELLVVIAIITILAAMLFPVFGRSREKARQTACMSNQRQLVMAVHMLTDEQNEVLPKAEDVWSEINVGRKLLICPTTGRRLFNSYVYNGLLAGKALAEIEDPTVALLTADGENATHIAYSASDCAPRHNGHFLAGYLDGHVAIGSWEVAGLLDGNEFGQIIEGCGSANFAWLRYPGVKFGIAFQAQRSGNITQMTLQWKRSGGYGEGTHGRFTFELQTNGTDNFPSGNVIARTGPLAASAAMRFYSDGAFDVPITATLTAGETYHLVIANVDPDSANNWSSPNTLLTRIIPWDGAGNRAEAFTSGAWRPWTSSTPGHLFNATRANDVNGSYVPILLTWSDGVYTGAPYYSAHTSGCGLFGANRCGELIVWDKPDQLIRQIGVSVKKTGTPGTLYYHLEQEDGHKLAAGIIAEAGQVDVTPTWVYVTLPAPVTFRTGDTYRLWVDSPASTNSDNCYDPSVPYGEQRPPEWLECGWGGTQSCFIHSTGGKWTEFPSADLSFSLQ